MPGNRPEIAQRRQHDARRLRPLQHGARQRVFGTLLKAGSQRQRFIRLCRQGNQIGQHGLATRQRAGLVDGQYADFFGALQRLGILHQNPGTRALPGADHDRRRRRQPECAGAGDDQNGDGIDQRLAEHAGKSPPADEGRQCNHADDWHEDRRDAVGQTLHRRLRTLCLGDQTDDAGEQRVFADAGGPATQHAFAIGRRSKDAIAGMLGDRHALSGEHRLVNARSTFEHLAVNRQTLARAHDEDVTGNQQCSIKLDQLAVTFDTRRFRLQAQQCLDRHRCFRLGARFEQLAEQDQRDDRRRGFKIDMQMRQTGDRDDQTENVGHRGAERDQHVHVRAAATQRLPAAIVKTPTDPELHRRRQRQLQPARQQILVLVRIPPRGAAEHGDHLRHQRQGQRGRNPEAAQLGAIGSKLARLVLLTRPVTGQPPGKAGTPDRGSQQGRCAHPRPITNACALGRQINARLDARQTVEHFFKARRAGGAGHAFNVEFNRLQRHAEAGFLDRGNDLRGTALSRREIDLRAFGGQIDAGAHPRQTVEQFFDTRRTSGTGHTFDRQIKALWRHNRFNHLTSSTGRSARCTTLPATEPSTAAGSAPRPCVPMNTISHCNSRASLTMISAAGPT